MAGNNIQKCDMHNFTSLLHFFICMYINGHRTFAAQLRRRENSSTYEFGLKFGTIFIKNKYTLHIFMKKIILVALFAISASVISANAQESKNFDNVTLNIKLHPIHTLVVNQAADQKIVDLEYKTTENYASGVTARRENHLNVYSTGGYEIKVKSSGSELVTNTAGPRGNINANTVQILAANGSNAQDGAQYTPQPLSATQSTIISATNGGIDRNYSIEYKGSGANAYLNHYVAGQNPTVYTTTVTYTIIAK